jgi:protein phosphatase
MSTLHHLAPGLTLEVAARTDPGLQRGQNEDAYLVTPSGPALALGVCDGMGGSAGGAVASRGAAEAIAACLAARAPRSTDDLARALVDAVSAASRTVYGAALADRALAGMGTTTTLAALASGALLVAQVGDSRAYVLRRGCLSQVTRDQTLVQMLLEKGQLRPEDIASYPFSHVILQAVGTNQEVDVDLRAVSLRRGDVILRAVSLRRGDVILICSDGLHGPVAEDEIARILGASPTLDAACEALVLCANERGGPDNVTCIVARVDGDELALPDEPVAAHAYALPPLPPAPAEAAPERPARALLAFFQRKST